MLKGLIAILLTIAVYSKDLYSNTLSNVINLNKKNFDTQITSNRAKNVVSLVHYYTPNDGKSQDYKTEIEKLSVEYDGMFKITAMNCQEFKDFCEKASVREFPTLKVYPPLPAPTFDYEGKVETSALVSYLGKFVENKTNELNNNNIDTFVNNNPNLPKCLLFTDKKGVPLIFKALALAFDVTLDLILEKN
jgi:thioredoxin-like negative regulator of GroEL